MKHNWLLSGVVATVMLGPGLAAQTPGQAPSPGQRPTTPTTASNQQRTITVSGCVQQAGTMSPANSATPGATGTAGAVSNDTGVGQFVLTNARAGMGTGSRGTTGASAASSASGAMYFLEGQQVQLRDQIGHQVEVTGQLASGSTSPAPAPPKSADAETAAGAARARAPRLDVQSVKMIAPTCAAR